MVVDIDHIPLGMELAADIVAVGNMGFDIAVVVVVMDIDFGGIPN